MLLIREEEKPYFSEECPGCIDDYSGLCGYAGYDEMCENCAEATETTFKCPKCNTIHVFFGKSCPIYCKSCKVLLPDVTDLKVSPTKRVDYYDRGGVT